MAGRSRIWTEVDFAAPGKQVSYLHLPYSVTRSAYGTIAIPVAVIAKGEGPTVLLMAGNHGDEYEGQVTLTKLIRKLEPDDVRGRVIVLPAANLPAALAGARVSPLDGGNLNRSFPGDPDGGPTAQIAHYIDSVLLPMCSVWLDLHSGGSSLDYIPFASIHLSGDPALDERALQALRAFGSPLSMVWAFFDEPRMATGSAHKHKLVYIGSELGGTGSVNPEGVRVCEEGVIRCLAHMGVLQNQAKFAVPAAPRIRLTELAGREYYVYAPDAGLFEPACRLGDTVREGQIAGHVHFVDDPAREAVPVYFRRDGLLVCKRHFGRCERGDCLAHLCTDYGG
ncbi:MAG: hypothetical protein FJX56_09355 [Alphaproteobacteria bacterium]|nr:hypothetical protein [Alphaproteobacteria bacterium]